MKLLPLAWPDGKMRVLQLTKGATDKLTVKFRDKMENVRDNEYLMNWHYHTSLYAASAFNGETVRLVLCDEQFKDRYSIVTQATRLKAGETDCFFTGVDNSLMLKFTQSLAEANIELRRTHSVFFVQEVADEITIRHSFPNGSPAAAYFPKVMPWLNSLSDDVFGGKPTEYYRLDAHLKKSSPISLTRDS